VAEIEQRFDPKQWLRDISVAHSDKLGDIHFRKLTALDLLHLARFEEEQKKNPSPLFDGLEVSDSVLIYQMFLMLRGGGMTLSLEEFVTMDPLIFQELVTTLTSAADFRGSGSEEPSSSTQ
jgi:hypothetical protein